MIQIEVNATAMSMRKSTAVIGNGNETTFQIVHNCMTEDVVIVVRKTTQPKIVETPSITIIDENTIQLGFSTPPAQDGCAVVVIG